MKKLIGSTLALLFLLGWAMPADAAFPRPPLIVTEQDSSPLSVPRRLVFPNDTLIDQGGGVFNLDLADAAGVAANTAQLLTVALDTNTLQIEINANDSELLQVGIDTAAITVRITTNESQLLTVAIDTTTLQVEVDLNTSGVSANAAQLLVIAIDTTTINADLDTHISGTSVHGATPINTADLIVRRDSSGDFAAGIASLGGLNVGVTTLTVVGGFVGIRTAPVANQGLTISMDLPNNGHGLVIENLSAADIGIDIRRDSGGTLHLGQDSGNIDWAIQGTNFPIRFTVNNETFSAKRVAFEFQQQTRSPASVLMQLKGMAGQLAATLLVTDEFDVAIASITPDGHGVFQKVEYSSASVNGFDEFGPPTAPTVGQVKTALSSSSWSWQDTVSAPAGADTQVQFNDSGSFAGDSGLTWDNINKRLKVGTVAEVAIADLHILSSGVDALLRIGTAGTGNTGGLDLAVGTTLDIKGRGNNDMLFFTNNIERWRIKAGGDVGINTTSPQTTLQVAGSFSWGDPGSESTGTATGALTVVDEFNLKSSTWTWDGVKYLAPPVDGTSGQFLGTDGSGNLDWATAGAGDAILAATQTFSGINTFTSTIKLSFGATDGFFARASGGDGTVEWVPGSSLPIDPKLIGINVMQNSATAIQQFMDGGVAKAMYIGMPPTQYLPGNTNDTHAGGATGSSQDKTAIVSFSSGTLKNLSCVSEANQGSGCSVTVQKNESNTSLTCSFGSGTLTPDICEDDTNTVSVVAGDTINLIYTGCGTSQNGACYFLLAF